MLEIRCSQLARPMTCAGSLFFKDLPPEEPGEAAREGTAAGELLQCKLEGRSPGILASNGVAFTDEMEIHVDPIAKEILSRANGPVLCEQRVDWEAAPGVTIRGQYDVSYVNERGELCIDDLKYGWVPVEVKENWQLIGYAIGKMFLHNWQFPKINLRIHQPRPHHEDGPVREWQLTPHQLWDYKNKIYERMSRIAAGYNELVTSSKCRYCRAATVCPALSKAFYRGIEVTHEFVQDKIDNRELSFQLDLITRTTELLKIKRDSIEALAISRLGSGQVIPGYSTEQRLGDRTWKGWVDPMTIEEMTGHNIIKKEMLSPAQAEKMGVPKKIVNALVERKMTGAKLVKKDSGEVGDKIFGKQNPQKIGVP